MKIFIIAMFLHKSYILGKPCSWDTGENAVSQSDCSISKWTISPKQIDTNSQKLKVDWKFIEWAWSKMGMANVVSGV